MVLFGHIALPSTTLDILIIMSVFLARIGTLFLAYDLLGRENGPLRWFTFVISWGLVSALARIQFCRELSAITTGFRNTRRLRGYDQFISGHHLVGGHLHCRMRLRGVSRSTPYGEQTACPTMYGEPSYWCFFLCLSGYKGCNR